MLQRLHLFAGRALTLSVDDLHREDGQTTLEYTVVVALVVALAGVAFLAFKDTVTTAIGAVAGAVTAAINTITG